MSAASSAPRVLIVNADDLGRTPGINSGIFAAHERGLVTSATLMVNHSAAEDAATTAERYPELGIGLHVALSGGPTALPADQVASLVDRDGQLPAKPEQHTAPDAGEVLAEVEAQLDRFRQLVGRLPTHLDGHHHCHRLPVVADAVARVALRHRLPVRGAGDASTRTMRAAGLATPDRFVASFYGEGATLAGLLDIVAGLTGGITEVMCHPAHVDEPLAGASSYAHERERELEILTDPRARAAVEEGDIRLAHFGVLRGAETGQQ